MVGKGLAWLKRQEQGDPFDAGAPLGEPLLSSGVPLEA